MNKKKLFLVALVLSCNLGIYAQGVSLRLRNVTVAKAMTELRKKTGYSFVYEGSDLNTTQKVNVDAKDVWQAAEQILGSQNVTYTIQGKNIVVSKDRQEQSRPQNTVKKSTGRRTVRGRITDANGEPIIGASVKVKGSDMGAVTDLDGNYSISADTGDELVVSYVGFKTQDVRVGQKDVVNVTISEDNKLLNEVVVVGYGSQLRKQITGAIASVKGDDIMTPNAVSADKLLQGHVAGLTITQNSAQPGSGMNVNIRGQLSPNGSNAPLYVIDGVVISSNANKASNVGPSGLLEYSLRDGSDRSPLATLNPEDISSIDVLKDASAAAIYGSQAANGVILITTKKGKQGTPKVTYNGSVSFQNLGKYYDMLDAWQFMEQSNLSTKEQWLYDNKYYPYGTTQAPSSGWPIVYTDEDIANQKESYNHVDDITRTGVIFDNNVSVSAGTEKFKVYSSLNFFDQKAILKTSAMRRMSGRVNVEYTFNKYVTVRVNNMYTYMKSKNPSMGHWRDYANEANYTNAALVFSPRLPLAQADGTLTEPENQLVTNPLKFEMMKNNTVTKRLMFTPSIEIHFTPWLTGHAQFAADETSENRDIFSPTAARVTQQIQYNYGGYSNAYNNNYSMEEYLTFDKKFAYHGLTATIGTGFYRAKGNSYQFCVFNLPTDVLSNNNLALSSDVEDTTYGSNRWSRDKFSQFGRVNYSYRDTYILGMTLRHDGSSAFAENHKWGWFPGVSAAWNVTNEKFMKSTQDWLDYLKLRIGYGLSGNESILTGNNYMMNTYGTATGAWFFFNNSQNNGVIQKQKGNNDLKWETDITFNAGLDFELLKNRLSGSVDYYVRTAKDLLDFATLPANEVVSKIAKNVGKTRSTGIELALKGTILQTKDWNWTAYLNMSHNKNYWVERNPEVSLSPWVKTKGEINAIYGWKTNGIFKSREEIQWYTSNGKVLQPDAYPGNLKYVDVNGDGVMNDEDIVYLGCRDPKVNYGLGTSAQWKNWQLDIDTYGVLGEKTYEGWFYTGFVGNSRINKSVKTLEHWSTYNSNGWRPGIAADITGNNNKSGTNDFTLKSMNYLRVKDIRLTYILPKSLLQAWKLSNASIYFDLQNSLLLTNYDGLDPEMEHNAAPFPIPRTYVVGVNIAF
ncbi:TonB-dependent receptor [Hallella multisaccharivorax]|uniref:TonB-dependent receptor n=1 Tax=Hallella multisaccharivorax TaxID=310514 RepID=UPI00361F41C8